MWRAMLKNFYKSAFVAVLFWFSLFPFRNATGTKKENVASRSVTVMPKVEGFCFCFCFSLMHASYYYSKLYSGQRVC